MFNVVSSKQFNSVHNVSWCEFWDYLESYIEGNWSGNHVVLACSAGCESVLAGGVWRCWERQAVWDRVMKYTDLTDETRASPASTSSTLPSYLSIKAHRRQLPHPFTCCLTLEGGASSAVFVSDVEIIGLSITGNSLSTVYHLHGYRNFNILSKAITVLLN